MSTASDRLVSRVPMRALFLIVALGAIGSVGIVPYMRTLVGEAAASQGVSEVALAMITVIQGVVLTLIATLLGLSMASFTGFGAPLLERLTGFTRTGDGPPATNSRARAVLAGSALAGLIVGMVIVAVDRVAFAPAIGTAAIEAPPWWQGLIASLYGGAVEEIIFRLFAVNVVVWVLMKITRKDSFRPGRMQVWTGIVVATFAFGALHLVTGAAAGTLTGLLVVRVLVLNAVGGITFGYLFVRHGLCAAMLAHFAADIVVNVIAVAALA